jgi:type I restriction enzyme S subunit
VNDANDITDDLPEGWAWATLADGLVLDVQPGFACGGHNRLGEGVPHLRPMNINEDGRIDLSFVKCVPTKDADREQRRLQAGDVLFNNTNSPALVGKTAFYGLPESRAFSNHMTRIRCRKDALAPQFCAMILHQRWRERHFESVCNNHVSQASVGRSVLLETSIPLPPLAEQKRIVAKVEEVLGRVTAAREQLAKVPAILKRFRQAVLAAACSGRLTEDWREDNPAVEPAEHLLQRLAVSPLAEDWLPTEADAIPRTWE